MAQIKKLSTELQVKDKLLDTSGDAGTSGQILSSTGTGTNWINAATFSGGTVANATTFSSTVTFNGDIIANTHVYGRAVDGQSSRLYRFGGLYLTWDSDSYGTSNSHSLRSTYGDTFTDSITLNSYNHIRFNIDSNNNNSTSYFEVGDGVTDASTPIFRIDQAGNVTITGDSTTSGDFIIADNKGLMLGTGGDAFFKHTGSAFNFFNDTGHVTFTQRVTDGNISFKSDNGSGGETEYFRVDGSADRTIFSRSSRHQDGVVAAFGTSEDLQIYHDATNSSIVNETGDLLIEQKANAGDIKFYSDDGSGNVAQYFRLDGGVVETRFLKSTLHFDNVRGKFGDSNDLSIFHNGNNSYLENTTGDLFLVNYANNKRISFYSDDGTGGTALYFYLDGERSDGTNVATRFPDGSIILLGSGTGWNDGSQIYHNGTNFYLNEYVGHINFTVNTTDGDIIFNTDDGAGGVTQYYRIDGGASLNVFSKDIFLADNKKALFGSNSDLQIYHSGSNDRGYIYNTTGDLYIENDATDGDIKFFSDDGSGGTTAYFQLDGSHTKMIAWKDIHFVDNIKATFGDYASPDLQIYHDGSHSYISDTGTGDLRILGSEIILGNGAKKGVRVIADGAVQIRHNDSTKIETTSTGATVTGDLSVTGDLNITGDINSVSVTDLDVVDKTITLGKGQDEGHSDGSGIVVDGSGASILWDEPNNEWEVNKDLSIYTGAGIATLIVGRNSSERLIIDQTDNETVLTADNDSDGDSEHNFRLNRTFEGSGANNFKIQKGGTDQLTIDTNANATFAGTIDSKAITALAKGTQLGTSGYYINSTFKDTDNNVGVFLAHNDTSNGTGAIAGINQLAFLTYGSAWTQALLLDSSQNATFAGTVTTGGDLTIGGTGGIFIPENIYHKGDNNSYFGFSANDTFELVTNGTQKITADSNATYLRYQGTAKLGTTSGGVYVTGLQVTSDDNFYRETINSNTGGESWNASNGWHRIIEISGSSGRGRCRFLIQTNGGSGTPCRVEGIVNTAWSNANATLTIIHNSYPNFITDIRVVRNGTSNKSFVDIKGTGEDYVTVTILPDGVVSAAVVNFTNVNTLPSGDTMEIHQTLTNMIMSLSSGQGSGNGYDGNAGTGQKPFQVKYDGSIYAEQGHFEDELYIPGYINHTGDSGTAIGFDDDDVIRLKTASSTAMQIDSSQNVKVVAGKLQISGDNDHFVEFVQSGNGDFTIDAPDDIRLDAGGGDIVLKTNGSEHARLTDNNPGLNISTSETNSSIYLSPNGTGNVYALTDTFIVTATESETAKILLRTDESDDNGDDWYITNELNNDLTFKNDRTGSQLANLTITPQSPSSSAISSFAGNVVAGNRFEAVVGSHSAPTYTFTGKTDTGMYARNHSSDDRLAFSVDGTERGYFDSNGLQVVGNVYLNDGNSFRNYAGTWAATTGTSGKGFTFANTADNSGAVLLSITSDSSAANASVATFAGNVTVANNLTTTGVAYTDVVQTRSGTSIDFRHQDASVIMTVDTDDAKVGIGTTDPAMKFEVFDSSNNGTAIGISNSGTGASRLYMDASNGDFSGSDYMWIGQNNDKSGEIFMAQSSGSFHIKTQPSGTVTTQFTIAQDGTATFAGDMQAAGVYVGSTNTSYDFYNNGTSYLNGNVTVDAPFTQTGGGDSTFSGYIKLSGPGNASARQIHFLAATGESNTEPMRITRYQDKMYFTYGTNAGDEAFWINSDGTTQFEENATFAGTITSGNITTNSRITFDYGGDHYLESGTDSLAYKDSTGGSIMTLNASTSAATFAGTLTIPSYIYHNGDTNTFFKFNSGGWEIQSSGGPTTDISATGGVTSIYGKGQVAISCGTGQVSTFSGDISPGTNKVLDRDIPCLFNSNFQDLSGTSRRFVSFNSTTINAASSPNVVNYLVMPYAGKVKKVYFKRVAGTSGTGFSITMYVYKNGANVTNSGAISWPSSHQAAWSPSSNNTFAAGDTIAIAFQKTTSGVTLGHISVGLAVELTDYDI